MYWFRMRSSSGFFGVAREGRLGTVPAAEAAGPDHLGARRTLYVSW
jgi:hypothetical protein